MHPAALVASAGAPQPLPSHHVAFGSLPRAFAPRAQIQSGTDDEENEQLYLAELEAALQQQQDMPAAADEELLRIQRRFAERMGRYDGVRRHRQTFRSTTQPARFTRESTQLANLPSTLRQAYDDFLERPGQPLVLGTLALLVGFYIAGSLSTIFGAAGFWEPTIALGPLLVSEAISRRHWSRAPGDRSQTLRLLNAVKVGFYFGVMLDALKLAG